MPDGFLEEEKRSGCGNGIQGVAFIIYWESRFLTVNETKIFTAL